MADTAIPAIITGNSPDSPDPVESPKLHPNSLANLRAPWKKGESGNKNGRPKSETARELAKLHKRYIKQASKVLGAGLAEPIVSIGAALTPEDQENLARGRLAISTIEGNDRGVAAAKALGSDKRVNMFAPETLNQNLVIMPAELPGRVRTPRNTVDTAQLADTSSKLDK